MKKITDINNYYLKKKKLRLFHLDLKFWVDRVHSFLLSIQVFENYKKITGKKLHEGENTFYGLHVIINY
ncbi:MAG: hypothetical protein CM15mP36_13180 [Flavobacteriales bacterium]|nr:MAG: hypothetical protein CM15mP36_13180 [Flavobacteriales bacterium]